MQNAADREKNLDTVQMTQHGRRVRPQAVFLFRITGIPYTEKQALRSRGDAYRDYQETTSVFFPWPPKARP